jgi:hypothetical protein
MEFMCTGQFLYNVEHGHPCHKPCTMLRDYSELLQLQISEMLQSEINVQEDEALFSAIAGDDLY